MMAAAPQAFAHEAYSREHVLEKLDVWRELLVATRSGMYEGELPEKEVWAGIDGWLDELLELKGR